jgi:hypothetical protein
MSFPLLSLYGPHQALLLSDISPSIAESAKENRPHRDTDEKRLKYFLVGEVPTEAKTANRILVHNSLVHLYNPAEFVVTRRSMSSSRSSKKGIG